MTGQLVISDLQRVSLRHVKSWIMREARHVTHVVGSKLYTIFYMETINGKRQLATSWYRINDNINVSLIKSVTLGF